MNNWLIFLKQFKSEHPELTYKQCMTQASVEYKAGKNNKSKVLDDAIKEVKSETKQSLLELKEEQKHPEPEPEPEPKLVAKVAKPKPKKQKSQQISVRKLF